MNADLLEDLKLTVEMATEADRLDTRMTITTTPLGYRLMIEMLRHGVGISEGDIAKELGLAMFDLLGRPDIEALKP